MKQMLTIVCKLQPTQQQATQIEAALSGFAAACNYYMNNTLNFKQTNNYQLFDRKAIQVGLRLVKVNHACTSQTYRKCNHIPSKTGKSYHQVKNFTGGPCGWHGDAGSSGVLNIPALGASVN